LPASAGEVSVKQARLVAAVTGQGNELLRDPDAQDTKANDKRTVMKWQSRKKPLVF
jgi:hypothetical protein